MDIANLRWSFEKKKEKRKTWICKHIHLSQKDAKGSNMIKHDHTMHTAKQKRPIQRFPKSVPQNLNFPSRLQIGKSVTRCWSLSTLSLPMYRIQTGNLPWLARKFISTASMSVSILQMSTRYGLPVARWWAATDVLKDDQKSHPVNRW